MKNHQVLFICSTAFVCTALLATSDTSISAAASLALLCIVGFFSALYHER